MFFPSATFATDGRRWQGPDPATGGESGVSGKVERIHPEEFKVPNEPPHPMFVQVDFGLVRDASGELQPKLVELQAFPSLYAYQVTLAQSYIDVYGLQNMLDSGFQPPASELKYFFSGLNETSYRELLRTAIVGDQDPENVILMEIDPKRRKRCRIF